MPKRSAAQKRSALQSGAVAPRKRRASPSSAASRSIEDAQQRTALEAEREQEAQRIADKFRLAREARERNNESALDASVARDPSRSPSPFIEAPATAPATYPQRVTVLVIMQPRRHGFGGQRMTANPVLCVGNDCYVSNGAGSAGERHAARARRSAPATRSAATPAPAATRPRACSAASRCRGR